MEDASVFTLSLNLQLTDLEALKIDLGRSLPEVKSSHRCEAIARGFGFRTYAALLADMRSIGNIVVAAKGNAFRDYLFEHQFDVLPQSFYRAAARVAVRQVIENNPTLTRNGIGIGPRQHKSDGQRETPSEYHARFVEWRNELQLDIVMEEFLRSLAFLAQIEPTKTVRPDTSSYRLKHIAEKYKCNYPEGHQLGPSYVSNGALIAAAIHSGFNIKTYADSPNVNFNMSKKALDDLDCRLRSDGARAQDRQRRENARLRGTTFF
jgi:hypothetical protein